MKSSRRARRRASNNVHVASVDAALALPAQEPTEKPAEKPPQARNKRLNFFRLLPVVLNGLRAATDGVQYATAPESDEGSNVTPDEARAIAKRIADAISDSIFDALTGGK